MYPRVCLRPLPYANLDKCIQIFGGRERRDGEFRSGCENHQFENVVSRLRRKLAWYLESFESIPVGWGDSITIPQGQSSLFAESMLIFLRNP